MRLRGNPNSQTVSKKILLPTERPRLRKTVDYLQENYASKISIYELANVACISPYHFLRIFRRAYRMSPHAYLTQIRLSRARALLRESDMDLAGCAAVTGFSDQSHLVRNFKRVYGVTPGQYAVAVRTYSTAKQGGLYNHKKQVC